MSQTISYVNSLGLGNKNIVFSVPRLIKWSYSTHEHKAMNNLARVAITSGHLDSAEIDVLDEHNHMNSVFFIKFDKSDEEIRTLAYSFGYAFALVSPLVNVKEITEFTFSLLGLHGVHSGRVVCNKLNQKSESETEEQEKTAALQRFDIYQQDFVAREIITFVTQNKDKRAFSDTELQIVERIKAMLK